MNSDKTEKEIQKELLEFIRIMTGLGPVPLSNLTNATDDDRDLALFYLNDMEEKNGLLPLKDIWSTNIKLQKKGCLFWITYQ